MRIQIVGLMLLMIFQSCNDTNVKEKKVKDMLYNDVHSCAKIDQVVTKHLDLELDVNFRDKTIDGKASYIIENKSDADHLMLDTKDLNIKSIYLDDNEKADYQLGDDSGFLGQSLRIYLKPETKNVVINYSTNPKAEALQWIEPRKTAGQQYPFLYTQSQAILARTWLPCQDGPGVRLTYNAKVKVPKELMAVMSASNVTKRDTSGTYEFEMKQAVPSYLLALAVGHLEFAEVGFRTGIYAEPEMLEDAKYEFEDMEKMLDIAEDLYGPYRWERFDLIVLPPSFPFGGMENPRLTFATPTILAGDKSLTSLVAHELAHSWSGNLVTNATWEDFWLNEGFTVYFERRIMEGVYDASYAQMLEVLGYQDLMETIDIFKAEKNMKDSKLKLELEGRSPDHGMTDIAYEKGYFFLILLENHFGREKFDQFLMEYFNSFAFSTMTTEEFLTYMLDNLFVGDESAWASLKVEEWIYEEGLPSNFPTPVAGRFEQVDDEIKRWKDGASPSSLKVETWTTHEWLHFLRHLPEEMSVSNMKSLDDVFKLTQTGNAEIACVWLQHSIRNRYEEAYFRLEKFLVKIGRRKFLTPLYRTMVRTKGTKDMALDIYEKARPGYHSVSQGTMDELLGYKEKTK